ncbi:hypothetical protein [Bacillus cereus]|nr:hypothetical protein [Bacillus cereus]EEK55918.1 hypothetical protein bcere0004_27620 [Bacillus cereus BGSC 6E1]
MNWNKVYEEFSLALALDDWRDEKKLEKEKGELDFKEIRKEKEN